MKISEALSNKLIALGMSDQQSAEVMKVATPKLESLVESLVENYSLSLENNNVSDYPQVVFNIIFLNLKQIAYKWLLENKPQAWFLPAFKS